jgi:hypothetical protein
MIEIGHKSPRMEMWWREYQRYVPGQITVLYCHDVARNFILHDFSDMDMQLWRQACYDAWR